MTREELIGTLDVIGRIVNESEAYRVIDHRNEEARKYCLEHLKGKAWGSNIWHAILDDAIRMREKYEPRIEHTK